MHYLCLIYVLRSSNYLSNVPPCVKTWKLSAAAHGTRRQNTSVDRKSPGILAHCHNKVSSRPDRVGRGVVFGTLRQVMQPGSTSSGDGRRRRRRHRHNRFSSIIKVVLPHLTCKAGLSFSFCFFFCGGHRRCLNTSFSHFFFPSSAPFSRAE